MVIDRGVVALVNMEVGSGISLGVSAVYVPQTALVSLYRWKGCSERHTNACGCGPEGAPHGVVLFWRGHKCKNPWSRWRRGVNGGLQRDRFWWPQ
jgi:hypothetical protein